MQFVACVSGRPTAPKLHASLGEDIEKPCRIKAGCVAAYGNSTEVGLAM